MTLRLDKCCCCMQLRTGCFIIGYLNLIGNIGLIIQTCYVVAQSIDVLHNNAENKDYIMIVFVFTVLQLVIFSCNAVATIAFLVGVHKKKKSLVKFFFIYCLVLLTIKAILYIVMMVTGIHWIEVLLPFVVFSVFYLSYALVIRSYYLELKEEEKAAQPIVYNKQENA